jgi:hypothetical protein
MEKGTAAAALTNEPGSELVDLAGGDAGDDGEGNFLKYFARGAATDAHGFDFFGSFEGDAQEK